ncbi:MAG: putative O-glycosylation ligase, exosortase A system-associated [Halioglobus sp.]|nr:putative O-glycosylation ligase, exosortase A system-associated [Halioglobus sp.]
MRDIIITVMVFGLLPFILRNAWYGVLVWSWLSYMNPHRLAWGFAYTMPFAQIVAIVLLASLIFNKESKKLPFNNLVFVWGAFLLWNVVCTIFAFYPENATQGLEQVLKIQLITFVTMMLMKNMERINQLIWVIVFSIGFYSVKGGIFTLMTGGAYHVYGPAGSYIMENNTLAVAVLMVVPLMIYMLPVSAASTGEGHHARLHLFQSGLGDRLPVAGGAAGDRRRGRLLLWWQSKDKGAHYIRFHVPGFFRLCFHAPGLARQNGDDCGVRGGLLGHGAHQGLGVQHQSRERPYHRRRFQQLVAGELTRFIRTE